ncbi:RagB/SusD family nutrient uptake outer membrane protein [Arcicella aquatica]|uniref:RagB/SusD family nutrient uptake outer membrane protein n=1 Tax=Arcicella aquatica TaxID=217141 RepID=A0ABU5QPP0_9BACT|nr:RagB/SusD family nutrient uptake outer membrane protein [Arcicella aquatica]MEA5259052.1 RagB/SusD family nutrient uptake outer membrane protein [Arcicella aquatica]
MNQLLSTYPSVFAYDNENNKEVIFDVQFMSSSNGAGFPSHLVPVAFWTGQGISNSYGNGYGSSNFNISKELKASYLTNAADVRNAFNIQLSYSQPFIKKYIDIAKKGTSGKDWPINFIVLRYADILLLKAEAILKGAKGTQTEVDALVNQVRNRAGLPSISNVSFDTLLEERRKEFLGEGIRWNDLVRSGNAVTKMNSWIKNDAITTINTVTSDFLIYPVPATEIGTKAGLYLQNPGYN